MKSPSIYSWNHISVTHYTWLILFEFFLFGKTCFLLHIEGFWAKGTSLELNGGRVALVKSVKDKP